jgi:hypothetical protein
MENGIICSNLVEKATNQAILVVSGFHALSKLTSDTLAWWAIFCLSMVMAHQTLALVGELIHQGDWAWFHLSCSKDAGNMYCAGRVIISEGSTKEASKAWITKKMLLQTEQTVWKGTWWWR